MPARKYTEEEMAIAKEKRKKANLLRIFNKRQARLKALYLAGDPNIKQCECGKYFDKRVHNNFWPGAEREWCTKCPMRPTTRPRKVFDKITQEFKIVQVKR